jgi:tryptophan synthase alpha chain
LNGRERLRVRFVRSDDRNESALIPYFVAGYPDFRTLREMMWQAYEAGVNAVELGIPYSDPVADGPLIARATHEARAAGATVRKSLAFVRALRQEGFDLPILGMTYANLLYAQGWDAAAKAWAAAGLEGAIIPDLGVEDSQDFRAAFKKRGLATVFFASPSSSDARIRAALRASTGFLYTVAVYGTTGARTDLAPDTIRLLRRVRRLRGDLPTPICVGFGVSKPEHVRRLREAHADGVIVGSALVRAIDEGRSIRRTLKQLKMATSPRG